VVSISTFTSSVGLKRRGSVRTIAAGHALVQNLRRGHYELSADLEVHDRVRIGYSELAELI
jgi:transposase, IS6 family